MQARGSAGALAAAVLDAVAANDVEALGALALDEREFRDNVWPGLPAARPERNLPFDYVWGELRQKSAAGLATIVRAHGGHRYMLEGVRFTGDATAYPDCIVHRGTVFDVRTTAGERLEVRLTGSLLERDGAWKVFSFVVD